MFTQFRVQVEKTTLPRAPIAAPPSLPPLPLGLDPGTIPTLEELGMAVPPHDPRQRMVFRGGETAGLARLGAWAFESGALGTYKETRNGLLEADDSSKLSPLAGRVKLFVSGGRFSHTKVQFKRDSVTAWS